MSLFDDLPDPEPARAPRGVRRPGPTPAPPAPPAPRGPAPPEPEVVPVSRLTRAIAERLAALGRVAVEGEVSALKQAGSGHLYFQLKDGGAVLSCVVWKSRVAEALRFRLDDGVRVVCHGQLDVYAPRGTYSLVVGRVERRGLGELLARLEELKAELRRRGWFDRRRPLPRYPRVVGVVTSRDADALQDFLRTRSLRWSRYPVRLAHTRVQGPGAAHEIAAAIARLAASGVDVVCLVRGGGALEDLWCFNELAVAEAVWRSPVPVVTGVGHETDVTLADLVADHRAHTPTDAAQTVVPDRRALVEALERSAAYLAEALERQLVRRVERLERAAVRRALGAPGWLFDERGRALDRTRRRLALAGSQRLGETGARLERCAATLAAHSPAERLARLEGRLDALAARVADAANGALERRGRRVELAGRALEATSPFAVLRRGYSITRVAGGAPLRGMGGLAPGARVETLLADGAFTSEVVDVRPAPAEGAGEDAP